MPLRAALAVLAGATVFTAAAYPLSAQDHHAHHGPPGESLGRVSFAVSCAPAAQAEFERAMALLHSFWWSEADASFRAVSEADPSCAMAHWGRALVARGNWFAGAPDARSLQAGLEAAERALALGAPTERERAYIAAVHTLFRDHGERDYRTRALAYESAMGELRERFPDDPEASILYALAVTANAQPGDRSFERQRRAGAILEPLFETHPDHPGLAHYIIHTYDAPPIAHLGEAAARRYASIAPAVPHAQHMPSHIFTRLGMWEESVEANRASARAAREHEVARGSESVSFDRAHAWDYLVYAHLQLGQDGPATEIADGLQTATADPSIATDYAFAAIPARLALERARWDRAARLPVRPSPGFRAAEGITHFARGLGAARSGDAAAAAREEAALAALRAELGDGYWSEIVEAQRLAVAGWAAHARGESEEGLRLLRAAAEIEERVGKHAVTPGPILPARELEGDLLMELRRPGEALEAYESALRTEPNRARPLYGAARAAEAAGMRERAAERYREYARLTARADTVTPEIARARGFR